MFKIGSATALVGDPSGHTKSREHLLDNNEVVENSKLIDANIRQIFDNHEKYIWKKSVTFTRQQESVNLPEVK